MKIRDRLPLVPPPESVWDAIEAELSAADRRVQWRWLRRLAPIAALAAIAVASAAWFEIVHRGWIDTSLAGTTVVPISNIGSVEAGPGTRLRIVTDRADEHRIALDHGSIHAIIDAPPRLFFVDTKSGTAVDLGCEYRLNMDENGSGVLRVTRGWVEFAHENRDSLIPAGAVCRIRPGAGPGLPYFEDAAPAFVDALNRDDIDSMIASARMRDTLTLWHLLSRTQPAVRAKVYDRISALVEIPTNIQRDSVLALDRDALERLRNELAWKW